MPRGIAADRPFVLVHAADLHVGSAMAVARRAGRDDDLRQATYRALDNLVDVAERAGADVVTLAGDLFDDADLSNPVPRRRLSRALQRLEDVPVAIVRGNHDHFDARSPAVPYADNVTEFQGNRKTLDLGGVLIHGVSYNERRVTDSLLPRYPAARRDEAIEIGLLHANVGGRPGHDDYAPCSVDDLVRHGYDAWLLGHIHKRERLHDDPLILYPGNIQGRHANEAGPRSVEVLDVQGKGAISHQAEAVHDVIWHADEIDAAGHASEDDLIDACVAQAEDHASKLVREGGMVLRLSVVGQTHLHGRLGRTPTTRDPGFASAVCEAVHDDLADADPFVLVDRVHVRTRPELDVERLRGGGGVLGVLLETSERPELRQEAVARLVDSGLLDQAEAVQMVERLWDGATQRALARLHGGDGA